MFDSPIFWKHSQEPFLLTYV